MSKIDNKVNCRTNATNCKQASSPYTSWSTCSGWTSYSTGTNAWLSAAANRNSASKLPFIWTSVNGGNNIMFDSINFNNAPIAPTLAYPASGATGVSTTPTFAFSTTDAESNYIRYTVYLYQSDCSTAVGASPFVEPTGTPQTGWMGQDSQTSTAYASGTTARYAYQGTLSPNTTYCWKVAATDPGGSASSTTSSTQLFTTSNFGRIYSYTNTVACCSANATINGNAGDTRSIGDLIVVFVQQRNASSFGTPSGWTPITSAVTQTNDVTQGWYKLSTGTAGNSDPFSVTTSGWEISVTMAVYHDYGGRSWSLDKTATSTRTSSGGGTVSFSTGTTATTSQANELLVAAYGNDRGSTLTNPTNGFTLVNSAANTVDIGLTDNSVGSTGTQSSSVTTDNGYAESIVATFIPNPTAPPTISSITAGATGVSTLPVIQLSSTNANSNYLQYEIQICSNSDCSTPLATFCQATDSSSSCTGAQTGWNQQNANSSTAYSSGSAATFNYQPSFTG